MGKIKGQVISLSKWVAGSPGSYKTLVCITDHSLSRSAEEIDTSSKCDDGYSSSLIGRKKLKMSISGVAEFTPASGTLGYADMVAAFEASTETDFKVSGTGFTTYYCTGVITSLNDTYNDGEAVKFDAEISIIGATVAVDPNA